MFKNYLLEIGNSAYGTMQLTQEGKNLLQKLKSPQAKVLIDTEELEKENFNYSLLIELIEFKKDFAKKLGISTAKLPKDIILELIATYKPLSVARLYQLKFIPSNVPFGFWEGVVNIINNFLIKNKTSRKINVLEKQVLKLLQEGKTIEEISKELDKTPIFVAYIMEKLILYNKITPEDLQDYNLFRKDYDQVMNYFKMSNDRRLTIAKQMLEKDYHMLRIGRAFVDVSIMQVA